jgi:hypothetical protein
VSFANGAVRIEPFVMAESEKVRLQRMFKGAVYKPASFTLILQVPARADGGVARWLLAALGELLAED